MMDQNICFKRVICKINPKLSLSLILIWSTNTQKLRVAVQSHFEFFKTTGIYVVSLTHFTDKRDII